MFFTKCYFVVQLILSAALSAISAEAIDPFATYGYPSNIAAKINRGNLTRGRLPSMKPSDGNFEPIIPWELDKSKLFQTTEKVESVSGRRFYDRKGRQRFFRGVNVLRKGDPWYPDLDRWHPQHSFNQDDIDILSDLNINIIRLGVMWSGVEPERGRYNMTYIEVMKNIIRRCQEKGIYVLVEMHQDLLSEKFCGEGVPLWAAEPDIEPERAFPWPLLKPYSTNQDSVPTRRDCQKVWWPVYHGTAALGRAFQNIYKNRNGMADSFGHYMGILAREFKPLENVIGYEIMNEPWAGDVYENPSLLIPGVADHQNLQPFYDIVAAHIREEDPDAIIFFEGVTWDNFAVGFTRVPGGDQYKSKSVLSHHFYHPVPNILPYPGNMKKRVDDAERLGCGTLLTEFDISAYYPHKRLLEILDISDQYLESWIGWEFKPFYPITGWGESLVDMITGEVRLNMAKLYSRTFAESVAGHLNFMRFDYETAIFEMEYFPLTKGGITDVRIHEQLHYPRGFNVSITHSLKSSLTWFVNAGNRNYVHIKTSSQKTGNLEGDETFHTTVRVKIILYNKSQIFLFRRKKSPVLPRIMFLSGLILRSFFLTCSFISSFDIIHVAAIRPYQVVMESVENNNNDRFSSSVIDAQTNLKSAAPEIHYPWPLGKNKPPTPVKVSFIDGESRKFFDLSGRQRLFRGVNVVMKVNPYHPDLDNWSPQYSFSDQDIELLSDLNINIIRLGVMWPGVEPERGHYNMTYVKLMKTIVEKCSKKGIYVIIEMHQDLLSEKFCGEGVPLWAAQPSTSSSISFPFPLTRPYILNEFGVPSKEDCDRYDWPRYHNALATGRAFEHLYKNNDGLTDAFGLYWQLLAREFKDYENVMGYEIMNEPWAGDVFRNPSLLLPAIADKLNLEPFYNVISEFIRKEDPSAIILFEGVTWDNVAVGFTQVPGGPEYRNKSVLAHHYYYPKPNIYEIEKHLTRREIDGERLGAGLMATEFGLGWNENQESLLRTLDVMDQFLHSWVGWEYKPFFPKTGFCDSLIDSSTGEIRVKMAKLYSRTYAEAVSGKILSMKFDNTTAVFELNFKPSKKGGVTDIRLHRALHYPNGFEITIDPVSAAQWSDNTESINYVQIQSKPSADYVPWTHQPWDVSDEVVKVVIKPK